MHALCITTAAVRSSALVLLNHDTPPGVTDIRSGVRERLLQRARWGVYLVRGARSRVDALRSP